MIIVLVSGCGEKKPEDVVKTVLDAYKAQDFATINEYMPEDSAYENGGFEGAAEKSFANLLFSNLSFLYDLISIVYHQRILYNFLNSTFLKNYTNNYMGKTLHLIILRIYFYCPNNNIRRKNHEQKNYLMAHRLLSLKKKNEKDDIHLTKVNYHYSKLHKL